VQTHLVQAGQVDRQHVQADEIYVKTCTAPQAEGAGAEDQSTSTVPASAAGTGRVWQAMALAVPSRLWLGGVLSPHRDKALIRTLALQIRACALTTTVLVCVDGLSSYVGAIKRAFGERVLTGKRVTALPKKLVKQICHGREKILLMSPSDQQNLQARWQVAADVMKQMGRNLEHASRDCGRLIRRTRRNIAAPV